jgi:hypothetical protein
MALLPTKKITALAPFTPPLTGDEEFECVQIGNSRKVNSRSFVLPTDPLVTYADMLGNLPGSRFIVPGPGIAVDLVDPGQIVISAAPAVIGASFVTVDDEDSLFPASRQLADSATIMIVDNGPGNTLQLVMVGTGALPANPTALVGLAAVNGVAATWMRSDAAPALDQAIAPTWTGNHNFTANQNLVSNALPQWIFVETDAAADNRAWPIRISGEQFTIGALNDLGSVFNPWVAVDRTGAVIDTINLQSTNLLWNGAPIAGGLTGFANPTASVGLAAVNGAALTAMRSDAAPPLSQAIAPTWTGLHIFTNGTTPNNPSARLASNRPILTWIENDGAADNRAWYMDINAEQMRFAVMNDAGSGSVDFLAVDRTLNVVDLITLTATQFSLVGTVINPLLRQTRESFQSVSLGGGAQNLDLSLGNLHRITLTGNPTLSFTNPPPNSTLGVTFTIFLLQDGTGTRTVTWPASVHWSDGITPTLTTTANRMDAVTLTTFDGGTTYFGGQVLANMVP